MIGPLRHRAPPSMKIASPLHKGGLQGGFEHGNQPTPALRDRCRCGEAASQVFTPSDGGDFQTSYPLKNTQVQNHEPSKP